MAVKRAALVLFAAIGLAVAAFSRTNAQVTTQPVAPNVLPPSPVTFSIAATPTPGTYNYTFAVGNRSYTTLSCDVKGNDGTDIITPYIAYDSLGANPYPINGMYLQGPSYTSTITADGQYDYRLNGALFFYLATTTAGNPSDNVTVNCTPRFAGMDRLTFDANNNVKTTIAGQTTNLNVTPTTTCANASQCVTIGASPAPGSGTITVTDSAGGTPSGNGASDTTTPTAGSYVGFACPGQCGAVDIRISGLTSGNAYFERSTDATSATSGAWFSAWGVQHGQIGAIPQYYASGNGDYRVNMEGAAWLRVRVSGSLTGTPTVAYSISPNTGSMFTQGTVQAKPGLIFPTFCDNPSNTAANGSSPGHPAYITFPTAAPATTPTPLVSGTSTQRAIICAMTLTNGSSSVVQLNVYDCTSDANCHSQTVPIDSFQIAANGGTVTVNGGGGWAIAGNVGDSIGVGLAATPSGYVTVSASFTRYVDTGQ